MSLLVAYEDTYCQELDRTLRRAVQRDEALSVPRDFHPVEGVTKFPRFIGHDWRRFRDHGFPVKGKPRPEAVLCIADADAVASHFGVEAPGRPYAEWVARADQEFTTLLRKETREPDRVHGAVLRWNLESTLIAAHDESEAMQRLAGLELLDTARLDGFLQDCTPDPRSVADEAFTDTFERPQRCIADLATRMGWRRLKKGDVRKDDALAWLTAHQLDKLVRRVPDLDRIARRIREVALAHCQGVGPGV